VVDVNPVNRVRLAQRVLLRVAIAAVHRRPGDTLIAAGVIATIEVQPRAAGK
jgi:hypothetical protein